MTLYEFLIPLLLAIPAGLIWLRAREQRAERLLARQEVKRPRR